MKTRIVCEINEWNFIQRKTYASINIVGKYVNHLNNCIITIKYQHNYTKIKIKILTFFGKAQSALHASNARI